MGLGIAVGPLLLVVFGVQGPAPYYACAVLICMSAALALNLKGHDCQPQTPREKHRGQLFRTIPVALCGAFLAGFAETSSLSFLAGYSLSAGYLLTAATLLVTAFGAGGTLLQLPIGWLADKSSYKNSQRMCGLLLLAGALALPFSQSVPWLTTVLVFAWGGRHWRNEHPGGHRSWRPGRRTANVHGHDRHRPVLHPGQRIGACGNRRQRVLPQPPWFDDYRGRGWRDFRGPAAASMKAD